MLLLPVAPAVLLILSKMEFKLLVSKVIPEGAVPDRVAVLIVPELEAVIVSTCAMP